MRAYLNSPEANKILDLIENGPEIDLFLTKAIVNVMSKPDQVRKYINRKFVYDCLN